MPRRSVRACKATAVVGIAYYASLLELFSMQPSTGSADSANEQNLRQKVDGLTPARTWRVAEGRIGRRNLITNANPVCVTQTPQVFCNAHLGATARGRHVAGQCSSMSPLHAQLPSYTAMQLTIASEEHACTDVVLWARLIKRYFGMLRSAERRNQRKQKMLMAREPCQMGAPWSLAASERVMRCALLSLSNFVIHSITHSRILRIA